MGKYYTKRQGKYRYYTAEEVQKLKAHLLAHPNSSIPQMSIGLAKELNRTPLAIETKLYKMQAVGGIW